MSESQTQLTRETYERLSAELEDLTTHGRTEIARLIQAARELGDLSENGDYHAAKDSQGKMEARIRQLEQLLSSATVIEGGDASGAVQVGSVVGIRYEGDDEVERFLLGSLEERREGVEIVSPSSPLGQALLGAKPGDKVSYTAPNGNEFTVEIAGIGD